MMELLQPYISITLKLVTGMIGILAFLRITGKAQMAQITPLDTVSAFVIGALIGGVLYNPDMSMLHIIFALIVWTGFNMLVRFAMRSAYMRHLIKGKSDFLVKKGIINFGNFKRNSLEMEQFRMLLRQKGIFSMFDVEDVLFETNGAVTVLPTGKTADSFLIVNNGEFKFTGGTITANGTNSVGVYTANGANSTTEIGDGTANSATLTVTNGGVGLYADAGSTQTLKGLNATVSGTNTAGSILFYNIPSATGGTAGKFDLSNNPGKATVGDYSYAFYTNKNIFTGGNTAFAQFLNDWVNTGTGNGIDLTMTSSSSLLLADVTNASNKDIAFTNIVPPVTGTTLQNANSQKVATLTGDYKYLTIKGADVKIDEDRNIEEIKLEDANVDVSTIILKKSKYIVSIKAD